MNSLPKFFMQEGHQGNGGLDLVQSTEGFTYVSLHSRNAILSSRHIAVPIPDLIPSFDYEKFDHDLAKGPLKEASRFLNGTVESLTLESAMHKWSQLQENVLRTPLIDPTRSRPVQMFIESIGSILNPVALEFEDHYPNWVYQYDPILARSEMKAWQRSRLDRICNIVAERLDGVVSPSDVRELLDAVRLPRYGSPARGIKSATAIASSTTAAVWLYTREDGDPVLMLQSGVTMSLIIVSSYFGMMLIPVVGDALKDRLSKFLDRDN